MSGSTRPSSDEPSSDQPPSASGTSHSFPVVGIGASAGGITPLKELFGIMPADSGMAFVVVLHLSQTHDSHLAEILQRTTSMPVRQVTETLKVEPNSVYVIPPTKHLRMVDGMIAVVEPETTRGRRVPIDLLFSTLGEAYGRLGICIVLSGTGSDGTLGLRNIKAHGGLALVQVPAQAEFDAMPRNAIATRLADVVLPVADMPDRLLAFKSISEQIVVPDEDDKITGLPAFEITAVRDILTLLRSRTGHDFSSYKRPTMVRRIARQMQVHGLVTANAYLAFLHENPDAVASLLQDLLISVTSFFRDPAAFEYIEQEVVPQLFKEKNGTDYIRVWVTACATGEEVYSLAILLCEFAERLQDPPKIQMFASDIDGNATAFARKSVYPETIAADVTPERLAKFFRKEGDHYHVKRSLREIVLFAHHNVLHDPPFCQIDFVSCRNLLIYLNRDTQEGLLETFHFALRHQGFLFLGSSESTDSHPELFSTFDREHHLYRPRATSATYRSIPALPHQWQPHGVRPDESMEKSKGVVSYGEVHHRLVEHYASPSILVSDELEIVHVSESAGRFLRIAGGEPTLALLKTVHPDLRSDLRSAMMEARQESRAADTRSITVRLDSESIPVIVRVRRLEDLDSSHTFFLVIFDEQREPAGIMQPEVAGQGSTEPYVRRLEDELEQAWEMLRASSMTNETSDEELRSANEELQSIIEELRSAGEELVTSKEELQSVNEELITVNQELTEKIDEVSHSNADVRNLMAAIDIATIFLDAELRIKLYTPVATKLFNILPIDIDRPLAHLTHSIAYGSLASDAGTVLDTHQPLEREVRDLEGHTYLARFLPYRSLDEEIRGVVLAFIDITDRKLAEESRRWLSSIVSSSNDAIISFTPDKRIVSWNAAAESLFGYTAEEALGELITTTIAPETDHDHGQVLSILLQARTTASFETVLRTKHGKTVDVTVSISPITDDDGTPIGTTAIVQDIGERKRAQQMLRDADRRKDEFLATLAHELRNPLAPILTGLDIIESAPDDPQTVVNMVDVMKRQARQIIHLVDDLLDVSRISRGKIQLRKQHIELAEVVIAAVEACSAMVTSAGLTLTLSLPEQPVYIDADPTRITQVIVNLLTNSSKFSSEGGTIALTTETRGEMIEIRVRDNGIGIPPSLLSEVFTMFTQVDGVQGLSQSGLGVGLSVVRKLVEVHGGTVEAFSEGEGMGSEFVISLPLSGDQTPTEGPGSTQAAENSTEAAGQLRILVVDDNMDAADLLGIMLTRENHIVRTAYDGSTAIETALEFQPDVCLLDLGLPDIPGHDVARRLRQQIPASRIIAISGWGQTEDRRLTSEAGFDYHLVKPVGVEDLRKVLV